MSKNVQVISGAINSTFDIFEISDELFKQLFRDGQDVVFIADLPDLEEDAYFWNQFYSDRTDKKHVCGIHGTLHLTGSFVESEEFPNRRESDVKRI